MPPSPLDNFALDLDPTNIQDIINKICSSGMVGLGNGNANGYGRSGPNGHGQYTEGPIQGAKMRRKGDEDIDRYKFWPSAMAMGSLIGKEFYQMLGVACERGEDPSKPGRGKSYLGFDFQRETLVMKGKFQLGTYPIPPALRPLDAELSFDDISGQGIRVDIIPKQGVFERDTGKRVAGNEVTVTVSCRRPPKFYCPFEQAPEEGAMNARGGRSKGIYRRRATAMDFTMSGTPERDADWIKPIPEGSCGYPTFWNTYRWSFDLTLAETHKLRLCTKKIQSLAEDDPHMDLMIHGMPRWRVSKLDTTRMDQWFRPPDLSRIPFSSRVLMEGLIAHGILRPMDLGPLVEALKKVAFVTAFQDRILESLYNEERIRDVRALIPKRAAFLRRTDQPVQSHLVKIRTALVTPTRLLISPPQPEPSNSVTRRYADKIDAVIRVVFTDEEDKLFIQDYTKQADSKRPDVGVMARVRRALQQGLCIGGRRFMPVASSASQQKEHAMWFIDIKQIDQMELRQWMGTVHETIVAKHAARMGLPFSTSRIVELNIQMGPRIPDVERNGYTFTDGVGIAGIEVMKEAAKALGATRGINTCPSVIQFRLGGAKGVLACWPDMVGPHEVRLRKSNVKFESKLTDLNVVRLAKYQTAFLNRQFILIMNALGIPEKLFIDIFTDAISHIKGLRNRVFRKETTKGDQQLIGLCSEFPLAALIKAGFNQDPMVLDICSIIECRALQDLKWRARVQLPSGVFLIGICDETGLLKEGEVFCQYQENEETEARVVTGEVIVCRAPALHPGDVRRARAVDCPQLRHLKNVIVFSIQGTRDLPNMLGGGDLDGDDYTLIWDPRFVRNLNECQPMDYTAPPPIKVKEVTQADLNENFVQYILNDVLGQVDNTHLALADIYGPFHSDCLHLSEVHSTAVDFAKTGQAAYLDPDIKPRQWPDFMDKTDTRNTYESKKILGRLFRIVQPDPHFRPSDIREIDYPMDERISRLPLHAGILEKMKGIKAAYEHALRYDMRRYRVFEPEIPCGIAIRNKRRRRARDHNLNEPLRDAYNQHVRQARESALEAVNSFTFRTTMTPAQIVARHCYALTYQQEYVEEWEKQQDLGEWGGRGDGNERHEGDEEDTQRLRLIPMTSFAWVFWQELIQLAGAASAEEQ